MTDAPMEVQNDEVHNDEVHTDEVHTDEVHTDEVHNDEVHNDEVHNEEIRYSPHPLEHTWTLWYLENDRSKHWKDMLNEVTHVDSVETFWSMYYTIKPPSELKVGCDYSMFKQNIKPMWEDEANIKGGRWLITVPKHSKMELDRIWLEVLLMMVGENFDHALEICGAVVNIRAKTNKISVWTANSSNELAVLEIGQKFKILLYGQTYNLQYQLHSDAMSKINSGVKSVYTL